MDQGMPVETESDRWLDLNTEFVYAALFIAFGVFVLVMCLLFYTRWHARRRLPGGDALYTRDLSHRFGVDRGLEPSVVSSLPIFRYSSKAAEQTPLECAVCLLEFGGDEIVRLLPKCGHAFHVDCIGMWFHSHSTCPLCRSPVEAVVSQAEPSIEEASRSEESSSSETRLCATCQHEEGNSNTVSFWWRRGKAAGGEIMGIRMEAAPSVRRSDEFNSELTPSSRGTRLLSLKRMVSMSRKSRGTGGGTTPQGAAGTSRDAAELDPESGFSDRVRVQTPRRGNSEACGYI